MEANCSDSTNSGVNTITGNASTAADDNCSQEMSNQRKTSGANRLKFKHPSLSGSSFDHPMSAALVSSADIRRSTSASPANDLGGSASIYYQRDDNNHIQTMATKAGKTRRHGANDSGSRFDRLYKVSSEQTHNRPGPHQIGLPGRSKFSGDRETMRHKSKMESTMNSAIKQEVEAPVSGRRYEEDVSGLGLNADKGVDPLSALIQRYGTSSELLSMSSTFARGLNESATTYASPPRRPRNVTSLTEKFPSSSGSPSLSSLSLSTDTADAVMSHVFAQSAANFPDFDPAMTYYRPNGRPSARLPTGCDGGQGSTALKTTNTSDDESRTRWSPNGNATHMDNSSQFFQSDDQSGRNFFCHVCQYVGTVKSEYLTHMSTHFRHRCHLCDYMSTTAGRLKRHLQECHVTTSDEVSPVATANSVTSTTGATSENRKKKCRKCGFQTGDQDEFYDHARTHIRPDRILDCPMCRFATQYRHHLELHLRNHLRSKPYHCPRCDYRCPVASMLASHLKSHSRVNRYRCAVCPFSTKFSNALKRHLLAKNHGSGLVLNPDGSLPPEGAERFVPNASSGGSNSNGRGRRNELKRMQKLSESPELLASPKQARLSELEGHLPEDVYRRHVESASSSATRSESSFTSNRLDADENLSKKANSGNVEEEEMLANLYNLRAKHEVISPVRATSHMSPDETRSRISLTAINCSLCGCLCEGASNLLDHLKRSHGLLMPNKANQVDRLRTHPDEYFMSDKYLTSQVAAYYNEINPHTATMLDRLSFSSGSGSGSSPGSKASPYEMHMKVEDERKPSLVTKGQTLFKQGSFNSQDLAIMGDSSPSMGRYSKKFSHFTDEPQLRIGFDCHRQSNRESSPHRSAAIATAPLDLSAKPGPSVGSRGDEYNSRSPSELFDPSGHNRPNGQYETAAAPTSADNTRSRRRKGRAFKVDSSALLTATDDDAHEFIAATFFGCGTTLLADGNLDKAAKALDGDQGERTSILPTASVSANNHSISPPKKNLALRSVSTESSTTTNSDFSSVSNNGKAPSQSQDLVAPTSGNNERKSPCMEINQGIDGFATDDVSKRAQVSWECRHCGLGFRDQTLYAMHMEFHGPISGANSEPFRCNLCGQQTADQLEFFMHIARVPHAMTVSRLTARGPQMLALSERPQASTVSSAALTVSGRLVTAVS